MNLEECGLERKELIAKKCNESVRVQSSVRTQNSTKY